jgi:hypothetical protein
MHGGFLSQSQIDGGFSMMGLGTDDGNDRGVEQ